MTGAVTMIQNLQGVLDNARAAVNMNNGQNQVKESVDTVSNKDVHESEDKTSTSQSNMSPEESAYLQKLLDNGQPEEMPRPDSEVIKNPKSAEIFRQTKTAILSEAKNEINAQLDILLKDPAEAKQNFDTIVLGVKILETIEEAEDMMSNDIEPSGELVLAVMDGKNKLQELAQLATPPMGMYL